MQTSNRLFDDLAKVASGAFHTLTGLREEIETRVRERVERMAADLDLVTREELDAVRAMAVKARTAQEELEAKVARLEAALASSSTAPSAEAPKAAAKPRAAAKRPRTAPARKRPEAAPKGPGETDATSS